MLLDESLNCVKFGDKAGEFICSLFDVDKNEVESKFEEV
jgi:hypothetical protein